MLRLKPSNVCPPDKFRFVFRDGHVIHAFGKDEWVEKTKKYAADNNYTIPSIEEMEDQLCRTLSGEWCSGGDEFSFVDTRFTLNDFLRGMKVLGSFALSGQVVSKETAEARALICSRCVLNVNVPGCASCTGMANAVMEAKGARDTQYDSLLKVCAICLCSNEAQIWMEAKDLAKGVTPEIMEKYKRVDECWKKDALLALDEASHNP